MFSVLLAAALISADAAPAAAQPATPAPRIVIGGPPAPDPGVAGVGPCVWAAHDASERARRARVPPKHRHLGDDGSPIVAQIFMDEALQAKVRACDPNLGRHWRYSVLAGAAHLERQLLAGELTGAGVDPAALEAAFAALPPAVRQAHDARVGAYLDVERAEAPDLSPLFKTLKLKGGKTREAARDYLFARELEALIVARMTAPAGPASPAPAGAWVLDHPIQDGWGFYPAKAYFDQEGGRAAVECTLTADGGLSDCVPVEDEPRGQGFGEATARVLTARYHFRTDSVPLPAGSRVWIPMQWTPPPRTRLR